MYKSFNLMAFYTETSLHAGGETSLSFVDKPIQREKTTGFPFIQGSGVKGAIREWFEHQDTLKGDVDCVFGPETDGNDYAGAVSFNDARLLLFPVKSVKGVFAYITCPLILNRLLRDLSKMQIDVSKLREILMLHDIGKISQMECIIPTDSSLRINSEIILEEYPIKVKSLKDEKKKLLLIKFCNFISLFVPDGDEYKFFKEKVMKDIVILSDDDFKDFILHSTEIQTRVKIGIGKSTDTKKQGNLFYEENLMPDTLFYSLINIGDSYCDKKIKTDYIEKYILNLNCKHFQIGGDETIGKGIVKTKFFNLEELKKIIPEEKSNA